jgi:hypothetical protein
VDDLFDKYDWGLKGYLSLNEFQQLIRENGSPECAQKEAFEILSMDKDDKDRVIDRIELYLLVR